MLRLLICLLLCCFAITLANTIVLRQYVLRPTSKAKPTSDVADVGRYLRRTSDVLTSDVLTSDIGRLTVREIESPAGAGSAEPNLFGSADGRIFLSWIEPRATTGHALRFAVRKGDGWSEVNQIAEGDNWFVNWADFPSLIALPNGPLAAHWLVKSGTGAYAYNINLARSTDNGKTWSKPIIPHRDGTQTEHGFVSLIGWPDGRLGVFWLDGRKFDLKEGSHGGHGPSTNEMTLQYTTIDRDGRLSEETLLDGRVCECCQTSAAITQTGAIVVYRDRSPGEIRDISVVRFHNGRWSEPQPLHQDGWKIDGCPVNGPSVAADGRRVAVAWFTAANNTPRVNVVISNDAGATFGQSIQVDNGSPIGRVDVLLLPDGSALVSWLERTAKGGEVRARRIQASGSRDSSILIAETSTARSSGFPHIARSGNEIIFAWTQPGNQGNPSRVRTAVAP